MAGWGVHEGIMFDQTLNVQNVWVRAVMNVFLTTTPSSSPPFSLHSKVEGRTTISTFFLPLVFTSFRCSVLIYADNIVSLGYMESSCCFRLLASHVSPHVCILLSITFLHNPPPVFNYWSRLVPCVQRGDFIHRGQHQPVSRECSFCLIP